MFNRYIDNESRISQEYTTGHFEMILFTPNCDWREWLDYLCGYGM